jgi:hypothetical protein
MMQIVVQLQTDERDPANDADDGVRGLYIKANMLSAVRTAVRAAGATGLDVGGRLSVTYTGDGQPKRRGGKAPKEYTAAYAPPPSNANSALMGASGSKRPPF